MNLFALAGLSLSISCMLLAGIIYIYSKRKLHHIWALFNISVAIFGLGSFLIGIADKFEHALIGWRIFWLGLIFVSVLFYHLVLVFCEYKETILLKIAYSQAFIFVALVIFTNWMTDEFVRPFGLYYVKGNPINSFFFFIWVCFSILAFYKLYQYKLDAKGIKRLQAAYLFYGMMLGFISGSTTALPCYGINIYPAWHFFISIYAAISTYAIFKYHIMDIRIAVTRLGIFIVVYSLVLGIPFGLVTFGKSWLAGFIGKNWFWVPMLTLLALATAGPFVFIYFQRRAEDALLQHEKRIQDLLQKASVGMTTIRELPKLLKLISDILEKSLWVDHVSICLLDSSNNSYVLKSPESQNRYQFSVSEDSPLIRRLMNKKYPVISEELRLLLDHEKGVDGDIRETLSQMQKLTASMVIPAIIGNELRGFIILGERKEKGTYSSDLIDVLSVVGNQMALAVENIMFMAEREKWLSEDFERRRFESLGTLSTSISHQVNNRFHAIMQRCSVPWTIYSDGKYKDFSKEELINLVDIFGKSTQRILTISDEGGKITQTILDYSKGKMNFGVVNFDETVNKSLSMMALRRPDFHFNVTREYPKDVLLWAAEVPLQDVIVNAVDNSCFAMNIKKEKDKNYHPQIVIRGHVNKTSFEFEIEDNGMGIKRENLKKVMDPMFSTKSHLDGTGMGTTIMQQFIQKHGGVISYDSEWGEWTKVKIALPLATEEQKGAKPDV